MEKEKLTGELQKKMTNFVVEYEDRQYEFNMFDELSVDIENINKELTEQPGKYAYWSAMYHLAKEELALKESDLKIAIAQKDGELRESWERLFPNIKKTEDAIAKKIDTDAAIIEKTKQVIEARKKVGYMETMKSAFEERKDTLVSLTSNLRSQRDNSQMKF